MTLTEVKNTGICVFGTAHGKEVREAVLCQSWDSSCYSMQLVPKRIFLFFISMVSPEALLALEGFSLAAWLSFYRPLTRNTNFV